MMNPINLRFSNKWKKQADPAARLFHNPDAARRLQSPCLH
jgi:hypothetical protein